MSSTQWNAGNTNIACLCCVSLACLIKDRRAKGPDKTELLLETWISWQFPFAWTRKDFKLELTLKFPRLRSEDLKQFGVIRRIFLSVKEPSYLWSLVALLQINQSSSHGFRLQFDNEPAIKNYDNAARLRFFTMSLIKMWNWVNPPFHYYSIMWCHAIVRMIRMDTILMNEDNISIDKFKKQFW